VIWVWRGTGSVQITRLKSFVKRMFLRILKYIFFVGSVTSFVLIAQDAYRDTVGVQSIDQLPLIQKEVCIIDVPPELAGGTVFPNQENIIYQNLQPQQEPEGGK